MTVLDLDTQADAPDYRSLGGIKASSQSVGVLDATTPDEPYAILMEFLDVSGVGAALLDKSNRLVSMNDSARAMNGVFFRVDISQERLWLVRQNGISSCNKAVESNALVTRAHLLSGISGDRCCVLSTQTLADVDDTTSGTLLLFREVRSSPASLWRMLLDDLALSVAEARLAIELHRTCDLSHAAHNLGLSKETVRTQLKAVFAKMGVSKQSMVVRRVEQLRSWQF